MAYENGRPIPRSAVTTEVGSEIIAQVALAAENLSPASDTV